jgi:hypothetical protein
MVTEFMYQQKVRTDVSAGFPANDRRLGVLSGLPTKLHLPIRREDIGRRTCYDVLQVLRFFI